LIILAVWFGSVVEMQTANQTKPNRAVQCKSHPNSSEPSAVFCDFSLNWFVLQFFYRVGSVFEHPCF